MTPASQTKQPPSAVAARSHAVTGLLLVATCCPAQDLDIVRRYLREDLRSVNFAQSLISLVLLSDEL